MISIAPTKGLLFCKPFELDTVTKSGFYMPDSETREAPSMALVVNVSSGSQYTPGDTVVYSKYEADEVQIEKKRYLLIREEAVLGTVQEVDNIEVATQQLAELDEAARIRL